MMWNLFFVFIATAVIDWLYGLYILYSAQRAALKAAFVSVALALIGAYVFISFVNNKWTIVADALGAFTGTYLSIKYSRREEK